MISVTSTWSLVFRANSEDMWGLSRVKGLWQAETPHSPGVLGVRVRVRIRVGVRMRVRVSLLLSDPLLQNLGRSLHIRFHD